MIAKITLWAQGIIVALIVGTILEMILPSGNNKKYIKMMIGLYVLYTIISPVVKLSNINIDSYENVVASKVGYTNEELHKLILSTKSDLNKTIFKLKLLSQENETLKSDNDHLIKILEKLHRKIY